jgi:hypothetical protein
VRVDGRRKKKLLVAFHFQFSNQAGWKCDECWRKGLVQVRNCAFASEGRPAPKRPVWARRNIATTQCPKSIITAESLSMLEQFQIWRSFGSADIWAMNARLVEAFVLLGDELRQEMETIDRSEGRE